MYYFNKSVFPDFPRNLPPIWRAHFLLPARAAGATLVVGEWGGRYEGDDKLWQDRFRSFVLEHGLSSFYWVRFASRCAPRLSLSAPLTHSLTEQSPARVRLRWSVLTWRNSGGSTATTISHAASHAASPPLATLR